MKVFALTKFSFSDDRMIAGKPFPSRNESILSPVTHCLYLPFLVAGGMHLKNHRLAVTAAILAIMTFATINAAHAETITTRTDAASYTPGGVGTLYITIVNDSPTATLEIRNLTIYFPWAGYIDGKWAAGGNVTTNISPYKVLTTSGGGDNIFLYNTQFTIPSWFGGSFSSNCPGSTSTRYGTYSGCVLLGTNGNGLRYSGTRFSLSMAIPTYDPPSFTSMILPTATFAVLVISTGILFLAWTSIKRLELRK